MVKFGNKWQNLVKYGKKWLIFVKKVKLSVFSNFYSKIFFFQIFLISEYILKDWKLAKNISSFAIWVFFSYIYLVSSYSEHFWGHLWIGTSGTNLSLSKFIN